VGEHAADARLVQELLNASPADQFELETVDRPRAAIERLSRGDIDAALLDLPLPHGLEVVAELGAAGPPAPLLVLSPVEDEQLGLQAVRAGAQDFLVKGRLDSEVLVRAVRYAIERHRLRGNLRDLSLLDDLTGLYNRRGFVTLATQDLRIARRDKRNLLLAFGDLDDLKRINDTLGHAEGDAALRDVSGILRRTFRDSDLIARIGGDEFAVLARSAEAHSVEVLRRRLNYELQQFTRRAKRRYPIAISLGFAQRAAVGVNSVETLLRAADRALYQEKRRRDAESRDEEAAQGGTLATRPYEARPIEILLVEDTQTDVELARRALLQAKLQNRLSVVGDGVEALAFLRRETPFQSAPPPDVILLDLKLPKKDGREVLQEMRRDPLLQDIPVVILTTSDAEHAHLEVLRPDAFLTKPVDFARLAQAVRSVANLGFTIVKLPV
jgi:diguanylate cyclase (GGDEF)-like protein